MTDEAALQAARAQFIREHTTPELVQLLDESNKAQERYENEPNPFNLASLSASVLGHAEAVGIETARLRAAAVADRAAIRAAARDEDETKALRLFDLLWGMSRSYQQAGLGDPQPLVESEFALHEEVLHANGKLEQAAAASRQVNGQAR